MQSMKLSEMNRIMAQRHSQGTLHNMGIMAQSKIEAAGHEMKENPPKILAHTARKFGRARMKKQRTAIILEKARKLGTKIPKK